MRKRTLIFLILSFLLSSFPSGVIFAEDEVPTDDPGAGSDQDALIDSGVSWMFPEGEGVLYNLNDEDVVVSIDWNLVEYAGKIKTADDHYVFVGIEYDSYLLDEEAHDEYHPGQGDGVGFAFGLGHLRRLADCGQMWVQPGQIIPNAEKVSPEYPVVVAQDPDNTGVSLSYSIYLNPTILYYERWTKIAQVQACVNDLDMEIIIEPECYYNEAGTLKCQLDEKCPEGYTKTNTQVWGCRVDQRIYQEEIASVAPGAVLTQGSQGWILGPLAQIYPGAYLKHPVWGFGADSACVWQGDVCYWTYLESFIPVEDPGWYDLVLRGMTSGTEVSSPRYFNFTLGQFGVYLIDGSQTQ